MSSEDSKSSESPKSRRPATRSSSLRQTLTFASVGKAIIAGVGRSKESAEDKSNKKAKTSSRRLSAIVTAPPTTSASAPRSSIGGETRPVLAAAKRDITPDNKVVTRRRAAAQAKAKTDDENMQKSPNNTTPISAVRISSRRAPSGLPKPRTKTTAAENTPVDKPSTPVRTGTRRRHSTSSDEGEKEQFKPRGGDATPKDMNSRPISPLPHRAALKNSMVVNATPPATPTTQSSKSKQSSPSANRSSPTRPAKVLKTNNTSAASSVTRPSSSASSVGSSMTPRTPKASALKAALTRSAKDKSATGTTPLKGSPIPPSRDSPSPLARRSRFGLRPASSATSSSHTGNLSHVSEGTSEDSDEDDVIELLLAPVASPNLAAPTPAVPRIMPKEKRNLSLLITPTKDKSSSASKADKTRLQPPLQTQNLLRPQASLRVPKQQMNGTANSRKSILTWEQLSNDASRTLGEGEVERMITDIPAPFSGPTSPALSALIDIPPSPCLSAIDSPGGFGSISQVLLPDVTPSPAVFAHSSTRFSVSPEASAESSSTYLRLQLASAEHLAHERLLRIQAMEEEIHNLKSAHSHQMEEIANQMAHMEREDQRAEYASMLEEQIWQARVNGEQAVEAAREEAEAIARSQRESALKTQKRFMEASCAAKSAQGSWTSVLDTCHAELESIHGERQMLALLMAELEGLAVF
ncbi:hypothetical protein BKA70DRAFT_334970 [Coprinopsis sp. MPI-PUGE-AT-0042]|nr:hypothetical protein BKA70DRAFT_334970 [Coprinopsis sp. MPI-PUGE-AT-0042]